MKPHNNIYLHNGMYFQCDHHFCNNKYVLFKIHLLLRSSENRKSGANEFIHVLRPLKKNMLD